MSADLVGRTLLGCYRVDALLGRGGMAEVYRAQDLRRGYPVALKLLREDLAEDSEFVHRFRTEAHALGQLSHANIVRYYDFGQDGPLAILVMDYIPGTTLRRHLLDVRGPLPPAEVHTIVRQVGAALAYAHHQGVIHRDVKPGNIMLTPDGRALLSDFGIAKLVDSATVTAVMPGTPAYMSPEQILAKPVDHRLDIYSFGVVLYEMVTGRRPFVGQTAPDTTGSSRDCVRWEHLNAPPPDPRQISPDLPPAMASLIVRALAKDPAQRWGTMERFLAAFEAACTGWVGNQAAVPTWVLPAPQPTLQRVRPTPTPMPQPAAKPQARKWGIATMFAVIGLCLIPLAFMAFGAVFSRAQAPTPALAALSVANTIAVPARTPTVDSAAIETQTQEVLDTQRSLSEQAATVKALEAERAQATQRTLDQTAQAIGILQTAVEMTANAPTPTPAPIASPTPSPTAASRVSEQDGMQEIYIAAGQFLMGAGPGDANARSDEKPQHAVYLDAYWIDLTEVTNAMYARFAPHSFPAGFDDHPVVQVSWFDAKQYCEWAARRLPTEAEWEKAASWDSLHQRKFVYPWGDGPVAGNLLDFADVHLWPAVVSADKSIDDGYRLTAPVGSYPLGASPYGVLDMAGNVSEWVADRYGETYYSASPDHNPTGSTVRYERVLRGGNYYYPAQWTRTTFRDFNVPGVKNDIYGFRCAVSRA